VDVPARRSGGKERIAIVTGHSPARNPRALKEAMALSSDGYQVMLLGAELYPGARAADEALAGEYGFEFHTVGHPTSWLRLRHRLARELFRLGGIENAYQLGYFLPELLRAAEASSADYYILHLEQALWVGVRLLRRGKRVGIDMEDWYSEDLLPETRAQRPLRMLRRFERELLRGVAHSSCPSRVMSEALAREFGCRPPAVIYNAFEWRSRGAARAADRRDRSLPSIHWYSQTVGLGRGLEDLIAALPHLQHAAEIHLRGSASPAFRDWLWSRVDPAWRRRIFVHPLVPHEALLSCIAEHDIGFAGEMKYCRSRDLTVTNKLMHYLLAGLATVASDTAGQREAADLAPGAIGLYPSGDARALARELNRLLGSRSALLQAKAAALAAAERTFCWERQAPVLLSNVRNALATSDPR
jgi:hypothetical protein